MILDLSEEKTKLLVSALMASLVFFIPISSSIKSILLPANLFVLLFLPYYRPFLFDAYHTLWARAALAFFFYILLACLWSEAPFSMRLGLVDKYSKLLFLPIFAVAFINPNTRKRVLDAYLIAMLLTCVLSILKAKNILIVNSSDAGEVFYNHIVTGFMVALGVYFAGVLYFFQPGPGLNRWRRFFYWLMMFLGYYQVFFINTGRTGYFTLSMLICLLIFQRLTYKKISLALLLFSAILLITYIQSPVMHLGMQRIVTDVKLLEHKQQNTSLGFRIQFHQYAESLLKKQPIIGIGTGGFKYSFSQEQPISSWGTNLNEPHSQYWLILAEQGLIGILLFLFFLASLFFTSLHLAATKPLLIGTLTVFCIGSFSDTLFCYSPIGHLLIIITALCFGELIEKNSLTST